MALQQPFVHLLVASAVMFNLHLVPLWAAAAPPGVPAACGAGLHEHTSYNGTNVAPVVHGLASVADCCKLCSENAQCQLYSWHPVGSSGQPTWCALQAGDGQCARSEQGPVRRRCCATGRSPGVLQQLGLQPRGRVHCWALPVRWMDAWPR